MAVVKCGCQNCFYCGAHLSSRHEHDHFPIPKRHGGTETVSSCLNCHDLKDRLPFDQWPQGMIEELMFAMTFAPHPLRLGIAKMYALSLDALETINKAEVA